MELKTLCNAWVKVKHEGRGLLDSKKKPKQKYADKDYCLKKRWESAQNVCKKILDTSVYPYKAGKKTVFTEIKYYKKCSTAEKYSNNALKKKYVVYSYGIIKLSNYLKPGDNKKLKDVVNNASNSKVQGVIDKWKK